MYFRGGWEPRKSGIPPLESPERTGPRKSPARNSPVMQFAMDSLGNLNVFSQTNEITRWTGPDQTGPDQTELGWAGLGWTGPDRTGLD